MAIKDLQQLRLSYTAAYAAYMSCVQTISEASQRGERPTEPTLRQEQTAFNDLVNAREAFFDALLRYGNVPRAPDTSTARRLA
jgi:hypothetical protein